jgi:hypothetical protein
MKTKYIKMVIFFDIFFPSLLATKDLKHHFIFIFRFLAKFHQLKKRLLQTKGKEPLRANIWQITQP